LESNGYIDVDGITYKLVSRQKSRHKQIKIRTRGPMGVRLEREESFFKSNREYLKTLVSDSEVNIPLEKE
jgi:predicted metal-dependent hydrolase